VKSDATRFNRAVPWEYIGRMGGWWMFTWSATRCSPRRDAKGKANRNGKPRIAKRHWAAAVRELGIGSILANSRQASVFIERLWRSLEYELIYPGGFASGLDLCLDLENHFHFYNHQRPHQALGYRTPADLFPYKSKTPHTSPEWMAAVGPPSWRHLQNSQWSRTELRKTV
jgi:hypothetical protein